MLNKLRESIIDNFHVLIFSFIVIICNIIGIQSALKHKENKNICITECKRKGNLDYVDYFGEYTPYLICVCSKKDNNTLTFESFIVSNK